MRTRSIPAALLVGYSLPLAAQAVDNEPIIVTATRTAQTADDSLASVTVIAREDIERQQATSVPDVLRGVPGLAVSNHGGAGKTTSVFLRGTESDHVLVLIDGIEVGSATTGTAPFQDLPITQIERIEVVRGPRSSLYGSEAIGGVIQIFTRQGGGRLTPEVSVGGGRYGTYRAAAGLRGGGDRGWFNTSVSHLRTQGFNACVGEPGVGGCFTDEPDKDGYRNLSAALAAGYRFDNGVSVDLSSLRVEGEAEFDGGFVNETESLEQLVGGRLRTPILWAWHVTLQGGRSWDESQNFKDGNLQTRFDTRRDTASFQNDFTIGEDRLLSLGLDYQNARVDSTSDYTAAERDNKGLFAQFQGRYHRHDLQLSLRRDDNQQFGAHITGGAAWGFEIDNGTRLTASFGTAFKAPTFNELYFPGYGNPNLQPEESQSMEMGIERRGDGSRWSLNAYQTEVDNLIAFNGAISAPDNIQTARIRGLEATGSVHAGPWLLHSSLTLMAPTNRSGGSDDGNVLPRRARQSMRVDLDRKFAAYRVGATFLAAGNRYDDLANNRRLGAYSLVDVRAEYAFAKAWKIQGRIENILDADYQTAAFYNQPGRSLYLTLRYQP